MNLKFGAFGGMIDITPDSGSNQSGGRYAMALFSNFTVNRYETRLEMGRAAARETAQAVNALLKEKDTVRMIFAAAPSQNEFLDALVAEEIDFSRIEAFHMDEYVGLPSDAPQGFGNFLRRGLFDRARIGL